LTNCSEPLDAAVLADCWLAALPSSQEEEVELHLLACDSCGSRLREVMKLADGIRQLAREGSLRLVVSDAFLKRAEEEGLRVRQYTVPPGGGVQCTVTAEDDILIGRLSVSLSQAKRIDLSFCDASGIEQIRLRDIPAHAGMDSIAFQESITFAKAAPTNKMIARLLAIDESGSENLIGEYTFNHTRSLPGPGAW